jgi:multidrug efflux pump subunit AcrA (membrane-fusion protein)
MSDVKMGIKRFYCVLLFLGTICVSSAFGYEEQTVRGPLRPVRLAALGVQSEGIVNALKATEGSIVAAGSIILELNDDVAQARVGLARVAATAEGDLRQARLHHRGGGFAGGEIVQAKRNRIVERFLFGCHFHDCITS